jgi:hypothetical protein
MKRLPSSTARLGKGALALGLLVGSGVVLLGASRLLGGSAAAAATNTLQAAGQAARSAQQALAEVAPALAPAAPEPSVPPLPAQLPGSPEGRLIAVYRLIGQQRMSEALAAAQALVTELPNFRLAQLVYADLLSTRRGDLSAFGGELNRGSAEAGSELDALRQEAAQRIAALRERPPQDKLPSQFVLLPPGVKHAIAVDVSRSRLYLFEVGPQGTRLVSDHYASIGKQGADKLVEGDQKTPLGVYFIADALDASALEDRFGSGALPLNYPSPVDRAQGRTGSGILLHGVPSNTYSRAPRATDGCVALANDDLKRLSAIIAPRGVPVVIAQQLQWVPAHEAQAQGQEFMQVLQQWQQARLHDDAASLNRYYAAGDANLVPISTAYSPRRANATAHRVRKVAAFDDLSVLSWDQHQQVMVVSFRERSVEGQHARRFTRQYWAREGGSWKILGQDASV